MARGSAPLQYFSLMHSLYVCMYVRGLVLCVCVSRGDFRPSSAPSCAELRRCAGVAGAIRRMRRPSLCLGQLEAPCARRAGQTRARRARAFDLVVLPPAAHLEGSWRFVDAAGTHSTPTRKRGLPCSARAQVERPTGRPTLTMQLWDQGASNHAAPAALWRIQSPGQPRACSLQRRRRSERHAVHRNLPASPRARSVQSWSLHSTI